MAILSKRMMSQVGRIYHNEFGIRPCFMSLSGQLLETEDTLGAIGNSRRRRNYALQESINSGLPCFFSPVPGLSAWMIALEDKRMVLGGVIGGIVLVSDNESALESSYRYLTSHGLSEEQVVWFLDGLPNWTRDRTARAADFLHESFYQISGWQPELMRENRLRIQREEQLNQAIADQKKQGHTALYAFEKERVLLSNIRAGDSNEARRILNEMLAAIYMSSPKLVVLRARTVELLSCLTRAAIEDNPLLEPMIERNHLWTEQLIKATSFENLSEVLMNALDEFIDGIYLHGVNRSNTNVRRALDFIEQNYAEKISLTNVAQAVGLSACRLSHLVKECVGRTVIQIIHEVRIRHARHLLERTSKSCAEIAYEVGFSDQSYFIKHFKRLTGTTPSRYRQ